MAEDSQTTQDTTGNKAIQQSTQNGSLNEVVQSPLPTIERKGGYSALVSPDPDAFPFHYQSPYIPVQNTGGEGTAATPTPAVNAGVATGGNNTTSVTSTQQQGEGK